MNQVTLTVPAQAEFLHVLRTVISSVAARQDFSVDSLDDLRLSVDEAGSYLLGLKANSLTLKVQTGGSELVAVIGSDAEVSPWPPEGSEQRISWKILCGLTDDASFIQEEGGPAIRLVKRRASLSI